jgi:hypothetical protein
VPRCRSSDGSVFGQGREATLAVPFALRDASPAVVFVLCYCESGSGASLGACDGVGPLGPMSVPLSGCMSDRECCLCLRQAPLRPAASVQRRVKIVLLVSAARRERMAGSCV